MSKFKVGGKFIEEEKSREIAEIAVDHLKKGDQLKDVESMVVPCQQKTVCASMVAPCHPNHET